MNPFIPFALGCALAAVLFATVGWWGFLFIFPWIGLALSLGFYLEKVLPPHKRSLARKTTILMILPVLLIFVPLVNRENFQLEGVVLLLLIGYFSKGVIHYAVAKVFGPLIWGRGFCGWACWTAAVLEWLPVQKQGTVPEPLKGLRYVALFLSVALPVALVLFLGYDVKNDYLGRQEVLWMFAGNGLYYLLAVPMAFLLKDRRAFCKVACPVSLVMKVPARVSLLKVRPSGEACVGCGNCSRQCPMDVDVMGFIQRGEPVRDTECILCMECKAACPVGAIH